MVTITRSNTQKITNLFSPIFHWVVFSIPVILLYFELNIFTVGLFLIITSLLSLKKPIFLFAGLCISLIANTYFADYGFINPILSVMFVAQIILHWKKISFAKKEDLTVGLFFAYCLLISLVNWYSSIFIISVLLFDVFVVRLLISSRNITFDEVAIAISFALIFGGFIGIKENMFGFSFGANSINRFLTSYGDPNFYCLAAITCIIALFHMKGKLLKWLLIIPMLIFCVLTFSKSLILLLAVMFLVELVQSKTRFLNKVLIIVFTFLALIVIVYLVKIIFNFDILANYSYRFFQEVDSGLSLDTLTTGRASIQRTFFVYFLSGQSFLRFLFGNGYMSTSYISAEVGLTVTSTHMVFLQMIMDFGLIGFIFFAYILIKTILNSTPPRRAIVIVYSFGMLFLSWPFSVPYFLLFIAVLGERKTPRRIA